MFFVKSRQELVQRAKNHCSDAMYSEQKHNLDNLLSFKNDHSCLKTKCDNTTSYMVHLLKGCKQHLHLTFKCYIIFSSGHR